MNRIAVFAAVVLTLGPAFASEPGQPLDGASRAGEWDGNVDGEAVSDQGRLPICSRRLRSP